MRIELEKELSKLKGLKETIEEMRASLWQRCIRKTSTRTWYENARAWILGRYKICWRSD